MYFGVFLSWQHWAIPFLNTAGINTLGIAPLKGLDVEGGL